MNAPIGPVSCMIRMVLGFRGASRASSVVVLQPVQPVGATQTVGRRDGGLMAIEGGIFGTCGTQVMVSTWKGIQKQINALEFNFT